MASGYYNLPASLPSCFLSIRKSRCGTEVPFKAELSAISYSLHTDQSWVSVLISNFLQKQVSMMNIERCICKYGYKELVLTDSITHLMTLAPENEEKCRRCAGSSTYLLSSATATDLPQDSIYFTDPSTAIRSVSSKCLLTTLIFSRSAIPNLGLVRSYSARAIKLGKPHGKAAKERAIKRCADPWIIYV